MIRNYMIWDCPNCGASLMLKAEYPVCQMLPTKPDEWLFEEIELIRHCPECHHDWTNTYITDFGDETETQLERKFWG